MSLDVQRKYILDLQKKKDFYVNILSTIMRLFIHIIVIKDGQTFKKYLLNLCYVYVFLLYFLNMSL